MDTAEDNILAGESALKAGDWESAKSRFTAALRFSDSPEAHDGLGIALWWLNEIDTSHEQRTAAFIGYKRIGNLRRAGLVAAWLARECIFLNSNSSAMNGWFALAERALSNAGECVEQGWLRLYRATMQDSAAFLEVATNDVQMIARQFRDTALETLALANTGLARVAQGRIASGMRCIDEAMAVVTSGEVDDYMAISEVFCVTLSVCELAGDLDRTENWCRVATEYAQQHNCTFLSAYCRTTYGSLLTATGRWREAEVALTEAIHTFEEGHRGLRVHAVIKLAELRIYQGRLDEAEVLLTTYEDDSDALIPGARLHLARGEVETARTLLVQALDKAHPLTLGHVPMLQLLVDVLIQLRELNQAQLIAQQLSGLAHEFGSDFLIALSELAFGRVRFIQGASDASEHFRMALERLKKQEQSLLAARVRLQMAISLRSTDKTGALTWARAAFASFTRIGAENDAAEALKLLRDLGEPVKSPGTPADLLTQRESEVFSLVVQGLTNRQIAGRLFLSDKTVEHHVGHILSKLGVRTRMEAIALSLRRSVTK